jgi:hypothetical protein
MKQVKDFIRDVETRTLSFQVAVVSFGIYLLSLVFVSRLPHPLFVDAFAYLPTTARSQLLGFDYKFLFLLRILFNFPLLLSWSLLLGNITFTTAKSPLFLLPLVYGILAICENCLFLLSMTITPTLLFLVFASLLGLLKGIVALLMYTVLIVSTPLFLSSFYKNVGRDKRQRVKKD